MISMPKEIKKPSKRQLSRILATTISPKLEKQVKIKKLLDEEIRERHYDYV
jgi:hypothetical protein